MRSPGPAFDLRAALTEELRAAMDELDRASDDAKAVHRCRVRLKRARALARVGRAGAPGLAEVFDDSARAAMQALARVRDFTALAEAARKLARRSSRKTAAALTEVADAMQMRAAEAGDLDFETIRAAVKDLLALALVWPEASARQIRRGARWVAKRARRAHRRSWASEEAVRRHQWRKREKDRYYAALLLDEDWPGKRRLKLSQRLGEVLGKERDALLLLDLLVHNPYLAGSPKAAARAHDAVTQRRRKLAARADAIGAALHAAGA